MGAPKNAVTRLNLRIVPNAKKDAVGEWQEDGTLRLRLAAPATEGKANAALLRFLAKIAGVRKSQVTILTGAKSREKTVEIQGLREADFHRKVQEQISRKT